MTEERILDFLDGNLGASDEEELLHRLAVSPERRNLLKQHLQMRDLTATLARRQYVPVPKVLTASLFTALAANGYAGPVMPSASSKEALVASLENNLSKSAETVVASKSAPLYKKSSIIVLASLISFIAGASLIYTLMPEARQDKFASSVTNIFKAADAKTITNVAPSQASVLSLASQQSSIPFESNINSVRTKNNIFRNREIAKQHTDNIFANTSVEISNGDNTISAIPELISKESNSVVISSVDSKLPPAITSSDIGGNMSGSRNPFVPITSQMNEDRSFWNRVTLSFRAGEGKAPGNQSALTGSMIEIKASYDVNDWFVTKLSLGQFMPYETQAVAADPGFNADGIRLLQLKPQMQYRAVVGAEVGAKFNLFDAPFEFDGGIIGDMKGNIIPRLGFFTSLMLQDNLSMNLGLEGMIYSHDISSSLRSAQNAYAGEHPALIGSLQSKESTGFIGPSIELVWHF